MPRDACFRAVGIRSAGFTLVDATISEGEKDAAFVVHGDVVKVEQVSANVGATAIPNARLALDRAIRRRVHGRPGLAAIVSVRD